jgi:acyl carrier protein
MADQLTWEHFLGTLASGLGMETEELKRETHLYNDIGIDSLGIFSVGMKLIKTYSVTLPLALVSSIQTVGDLFDAMEKAKDGSG